MQSEPFHHGHQIALKPWTGLHCNPSHDLFTLPKFLLSSEFFNKLLLSHPLLPQNLSGFPLTLTKYAFSSESLLRKKWRRPPHSRRLQRRITNQVGKSKLMFWPPSFLLLMKLDLHQNKAWEVHSPLLFCCNLKQSYFS